MATKEFRDGAEMVGKAAGEKFENIGNKVDGLKKEFSGYADQQAKINEELINKADNHEERMRQLEENRFFVRSARRGIEDLDPIQQDRLVGWLQKLVKELNDRGYPINRNQQKFLTNMLQFIGAIEAVAEVPDLNMLGDFGDSELHEVIYKIFLIVIYLHDNSFDILGELEDITNLFKLSKQNKDDIQQLLENERIPLLGIDGLVGMYDSSRPLNSFTPQELFANLREIHTHPLLEADAPDETRLLYIQGFALLAGGKNFSEEQYSYIKALANVLKCSEALNNLEQLCVNPQKFPLRKWTSVLTDEVLKYSWLLDGCMVLCQQSEISLDTVDTSLLVDAAKSLRILQNKDFIDASAALCLTENPKEILKAIRTVAEKTSGWEHILEYRGLTLNGAFDDLQQQLQDVSLKLMNLGMEGTSLLTGVDFDLSSYVDMGDMDDSFAEKMATKAKRALVSSGRESEAKKLQEYGKKVSEYLINNGSALGTANSIISAFHLETIPCETKIRDVEIDNSALNDDWYDDYTNYHDKITDTIDSFSNAIDLMDEQLTLIADGKYHTSILAIKRQEQEAQEKKKQEELEAKKSVLITSADGNYKMKVHWEEIPTGPFPLDEVRKIASAGNRWFVMAEKPYFLDEGNIWHEVEGVPFTSVNELFSVKGNIFVTTYGDDAWYTTDCEHWHKANLPANNGVLALIYHDDAFILYTKKSCTYTYTEKGFIFDSTEEGYYYSTEAWKSPRIDGGWESWGSASYSSEGMSLQSNIACNDKLIVAAFGYDFGYKMNKKKSSDGERVEYFDGNRWKDATWPAGMYMNGKFYFHHGHGIYLQYSRALTSEKGYDWQEQTPDGSFSSDAGICGDAFMTEPNSDGVSLVSLDGLSVQLVAVADPGEWKAFGFGADSLLGVYARTKHELSIVLGHLQIMKQ